MNESERGKERERARREREAAPARMQEWSADTHICTATTTTSAARLGEASASVTMRGVRVCRRGHLGFLPSESN